MKEEILIRIVVQILFSYEWERQVEVFSVILALCDYDVPEASRES